MTPAAIAKYQYIDKRALTVRAEQLTDELGALSRDIGIVRRYLATGALKALGGSVAVILGFASRDVDGNVKNNILSIILGVVTILIGMIVAGILDTQAAASGAANQPIGSFSGALPINNLIPLIIRVVLLMVGIGMIGIGGAGMVGYGPMNRM